MSRKYFGGGSKTPLTIKILAVVFIVAIIGGGAYILTGGSMFGLLPTEDVYVTTQFYVLEAGGVNAAVNGITVNIYDADGNFLQVATASAAGLVQLASMPAGSVILIQTHQAAVATADPYINPVVTRTIPLGQSGDTVTMLPIYVWDEAATVPVITVSDGINAVSDTTNYFFNTTDTKAVITLAGVDTDTAWGMEPFTDLVTGYTYSGPILVWQTNVSQAWTTVPDYVLTDPDYNYYIWNIDRVIDNTVIPTDNEVVVTLLPQGAFTGNAAVIIDAFALVRTFSGLLQMSSLSDSGTGTLTAITTVAD